MKGFKTIGYVATTMLAILTLPEVQDLVSEYPRASVVINGGIIVILRVLSTTPIFNKEKRHGIRKPTKKR